MSSIRWLWQAKLAKVIDGDTVDMYLDTGFHTVRKERIRLAGVNAPEIEKETKDAGLMSKHFVEGWTGTIPLPGGEEYPFIVETFKTDSFGRYIGKIWFKDAFFAGGKNLSEVLLDNSLAVPFDPKGH